VTNLKKETVEMLKALVRRVVGIVKSVKPKTVVSYLVTAAVGVAAIAATVTGVKTADMLDVESVLSALTFASAIVLKTAQAITTASEALHDIKMSM
jgi:hypothetical protein